MAQNSGTARPTSETGLTRNVIRLHRNDFAGGSPAIKHACRNSQWLKVDMVMNSRFPFPSKHRGCAEVCCSDFAEGSPQKKEAMMLKVTVQNLGDIKIFRC